MPLSYQTHTGDGSTTNFTITFNYLPETVVVSASPKGILVYLDEVKQTSGYDIVGGDVVFTSAPGASVAIKILRSTPRGKADRLVDYEDSTTLTSALLDTSALQLLYISQEAFEQSDSGGGATPTYLPFSTSLDAWDAESQEISRVATPVAGTDAVNKTYADDSFMPYDSTAGVYDASRSSLNKKIDGIEDPLGNQQAATKKYVDDIASYGTAGVPQSFKFTADGATNAFTLEDAPYVEAEMLIVSVDGVVQVPIDDYSVTGGEVDSTLNFVSFIPPNGTIVSVQNFGKARFVAAADIEDGSITTEKLADLAVTTAKLDANSVSAPKMRDSAITTAKIADANVTTAKLEDSSVTTGKIATSAVTEDKIAPDSVTYGRLKDTGFTSTNSGSTVKLLRIDAGSANLTQGTLGAADISDFNSSVENRSISAFNAATANLNLNSKRILNVATPTSSSDAANKSYVDASTQSAMKGTLIQDTVLAASSGNFDVTGWFDSKYLWYQFVCLDFRSTHDGAFIGLNTQNSSGAWANGLNNYEVNSRACDTSSFGSFIYNGAVAPCLDNTTSSTEGYADFTIRMLNNTGSGGRYITLQTEGVAWGKTFGHIHSGSGYYDLTTQRQSTAAVYGLRFRSIVNINNTSTTGSIRSGARVLVYGYEGLS